MSDRCPTCYRKHTLGTYVVSLLDAHGPLTTYELQNISELPLHRVQNEIHRLHRAGLVVADGTIDYQLRNHQKLRRWRLTQVESCGSKTQAS